MFGRSRPVIFNPYGRRRSRFRVPRWLVLLLVGAALGVAGVITLQERYLPPRLSAAQSAQLRGEIDDVRRDSIALHAELAQATARMNAALAEREQMGAELAAGASAAQSARQVAASLIAALPPDPRGGAIEIRAARFEPRGGELAYDLVLTRGRAGNAPPIKPMGAVLQIVVSGATARGTETSTAVSSSELTVGEIQSVRGSVELPAGFKPRAATITLLDKPGGKRLGMRVIRVEG
ncbi:MAG: hypothetical protein ABIO45_10545 [Burkholderiaceae bacterium]